MTRSPSSEEPTQINLPGTYDVFISHSWRYDQEWTDMVALLDDALGRKWRNWSLPWHDPGLDRFTPQGHAELVDILDGQLSQCGALLVLADICRGNRGSTWLGIEIELGKKYGKPIFGVATKSDRSFPDQFRKDVVTVVNWGAKDIVRLLTPL
jgi:hypothetical protein